MPASKPAYADRIAQDPEIMLGKPTVEAASRHVAA